MLAGLQNRGSPAEGFVTGPPRHPFQCRVPFENAALGIGQHDSILCIHEQSMVESSLSIGTAPPFQYRRHSVGNRTEELEFLDREVANRLGMGRHGPVHAVLDKHRYAHARDAAVFGQKLGRREPRFFSQVPYDDRQPFTDGITGLGMCTALNRQSADEFRLKADACDHGKVIV